MNESGKITRRDFLAAGMAGAGLLAAGSASLPAFTKGEPNPYAPFIMGIQSYSLRHFPMAEMLRKVRELGLRDVEGYDSHFPITDDPAKIGEYRAALQQAGVRIHTFGVVGFGGDKTANRRTFAFAKAMGIRNLSADPSPDSFDDLDGLVREFGINIGIHNHGPGNRYAHPEAIAQEIEGHDKRIGFCVDAGHYLRSHVNPVEVVQRYGPRVYGCHLKDVKATPGGGDEFTEIGKGELDTVGLLRALKAARFKQLLSLEYEIHEDDPMPYMKECLDATRAALKKI